MKAERKIQLSPNILKENEPSTFLESLPLEKCRYKTDPVTNIAGWYAPDGLAFRMTKQFIVDCDHSPGEMRVFLPVASTELFQTDPEGWSYDEFMMDTPTNFMGKWFCLELGLKEMIVTVRQEIDPYYLDADKLLEFNGFLLPLDGVAEASSIEWTQEYAFGTPDSCKIEVVPYREDRKLIIPKPREKKNEVLLPLGVKTSKEQQ